MDTQLRSLDSHRGPPLSGCYLLRSITTIQWSVSLSLDKRGCLLPHHGIEQHLGPDTGTGSPRRRSSHTSWQECRHAGISTDTRSTSFRTKKRARHKGEAQLRVRNVRVPSPHPDDTRRSSVTLCSSVPSSLARDAVLRTLTVGEMPRMRVGQDKTGDPGERVPPGSAGDIVLGPETSRGHCVRHRLRIGTGATRRDSKYGNQLTVAPCALEWQVRSPRRVHSMPD